MEGGYQFLAGGFVLLVLLPGRAAIFYRAGYRVAGPMPTLFTFGLFLARMFAVPV